MFLTLFFLYYTTLFFLSFSKKKKKKKSFLSSSKPTRPRATSWSSGLARGSGRVALLDYGQSKQLPERERVAFAALLLALAPGFRRADERVVADRLHELGLRFSKDEPQTLKKMAYAMFDTRCSYRYSCCGLGGVGWEGKGGRGLRAERSRRSGEESEKRSRRRGGRGGSPL